MLVGMLIGAGFNMDMPLRNWIIRSLMILQEVIDKLEKKKLHSSLTMEADFLVIEATYGEVNEDDLSFLAECTLN